MKISKETGATLKIILLNMFLITFVSWGALGCCGESSPSETKTGGATTKTGSQASNNPKKSEISGEAVVSKEDQKIDKRHTEHAGHGKHAGDKKRGEHGGDKKHAEHAGHKKHAEHGEHAGMPHDFSDTSRWIERFESPERTAWQKPEEVIRALDVPMGGSVADIGAGTGYFLPFLQKVVGEKGRVIGVDIERNMVDFMTERAKKEGWSNVEARKVEVGQHGLSVGEVDRVLIVNTWHHFGDRVKYAKLLKEGIKSGGALLVVDFTMDSPVGPSVTHRLTSKEIEDELQAAGFKTSLLEETLPNQYMIIARRP